MAAPPFLGAMTAAFCLVALPFCTAASAEESPVPIPQSRPPISAKADRVTGPTVTETIDAGLKQGLDALSNRDAAAALAARDAMPAHGFDRRVLTFAIAVSGQKGVSSHDVAAAQNELKGWPGLDALRYHLERALYRENAPAGKVLAEFATTPPETTQGTLILARALVTQDRGNEAASLLRGLWAKERLDTASESEILSEFSGLLTTADHRRRMEMLLYHGDDNQAARFADLGKAQSLYRAWVAVARRAHTAEALIAAVDPSWHDAPAYLFIRVEYLRHQEKYQEAAALLAGMPRDGQALVDPGQWWIEQRIISRGLFDQGKTRAAYEMAANHVATDPADIVDAEFHAGWYALRGLDDATAAATHFRKILTASDRPLSASRAWYWLGRAAEAGGPGDATEFFKRAAGFPATYYGQLAAARLGRDKLDIAYPAPAAGDRVRFDNREAVRAIARLEETGHGWRADSLYRALARQLTSPGELALLVARAEKSRNHQLSLQLGKLAFGRGLDVAALAFPIGVIPPTAKIDGAGKALAYAIARQESAFNPAAVSPANARGLLQLLPGTAKNVASRHGLAYSRERLTTDSAYNATLGAHYLGEQIDRFDGSYVLTFIAYNAGPRRVREWIERYGDPRGKPIDTVIDWVEHIPFAETRGYVQRVMENYQIYKTRLGQEADIVDDLRMGRRQLSSIAAGTPRLSP